jgi:hypothetical protein
VWLLRPAPSDDPVNLEITKTGISEIRAGDVGQTIGVATGVDVSDVTSGEVGVVQISVTEITTGKTYAPQ